MSPLTAPAATPATIAARTKPRVSAKASPSVSPRRLPSNRRRIWGANACNAAPVTGAAPTTTTSAAGRAQPQQKWDEERVRGIRRREGLADGDRLEGPVGRRGERAPTFGPRQMHRGLEYADATVLRECPVPGSRMHGYPPDKQAKATITVLEQAEVLSEHWAAA